MFRLGKVYLLRSPVQVGMQFEGPFSKLHVLEVLNMTLGLKPWLGCVKILGTARTSPPAGAAPATAASFA